MNVRQEKLFIKLHVNVDFNYNKHSKRSLYISQYYTSYLPRPLLLTFGMQLVKLAGTAGVGLKHRMKNNQKGFNFNFLRDDSKFI